MRDGISIVEWLREVRELASANSWEGWNLTVDACVNAEHEITKLQAALRPFAALADEVAREALTSPTDSTSGLLTINYGDLRRAAEALRTMR